MAKHTHLVLDLEQGEPIALALPAEGGGTSSDSLILDASCDAALVVGDCVYAVGIDLGGLPQVALCDITNPVKVPAIGLLESKSAPTICKVRLFGVSSSFFTLTGGQKYYVGFNGKLTLTQPLMTGRFYVQIMGIALDASTFLVKVNYPIVRNVP
jgi:hypothetical protein